MNRPYGAYLTRTDVVIFSRRYQPLVTMAWDYYDPFSRVLYAPGPVIPVDPHVRINFEQQRWFRTPLDWSNPTLQTEVWARDVMDALKRPTLHRAGRLLRKGPGR